MSRAARAFLVWVMVIAMPMQGLAASAMLFCGPSHERMMRGLAIDAPAPAHAAPGHASRQGHDHAAPGHAHAMPGDAAAGHFAAHGDDGDDGGGLSPHLGKFSCSACAACCAMLALPASFSPPGVVAAAHPMPASSSAAVPSLPPDGLERPPRAILA